MIAFALTLMVAVVDDPLGLLLCQSIIIIISSIIIIIVYTLRKINQVLCSYIPLLLRIDELKGMAKRLCSIENIDISSTFGGKILQQNDTNRSMNQKESEYTLHLARSLAQSGLCIHEPLTHSFLYDGQHCFERNRLWSTHSHGVLTQISLQLDEIHAFRQPQTQQNRLQIVQGNGTVLLYIQNVKGLSNVVLYQ